MGNTYVVLVWDGPVNGPYYWLEIYRGESLFQTIKNIWWAKRNGWGCIKLEYRP